MIAKPMSVWRKIAYGAGDSGFSLTSTALALLYLDFLINVVGLDPGLAGVSIGVGRIWDALNDLIIGTLSDRTRSRWGRRRPYLLFGALPFGLAFILMWLVPATYPRAAMDNFYLPVGVESASAVFKERANNIETHGGATWRRVSRHLTTAWPPGGMSFRSYLAWTREGLRRIAVS